MRATAADAATWRGLVEVVECGLLLQTRPRGVVLLR